MYITTQKLKGHALYVVLMILVLFVLSVALVAILWFNTKLMSDLVEGSDVALYNNGVCSSCGGDYQFYQCVGGNRFSSVIYLYKCEDCDKIIELHSQQQ